MSSFRFCLLKCSLSRRSPAHVQITISRIFHHSCTLGDSCLAMTITLKYMKNRGYMKVAKLILATAGKFPGDYIDERCIEVPKRGLDQNLGRLPIVKIDGEEIGQSAAINFYLATKFGIMGATLLETARIVSLSEHLREMNSAYRTLVPTGTQPSKRALDLWFEGGARDTSGHAIEETISERYLHWWMGRIENVVGRNGFAVGSQLTLADLLLYNAFAETETLRDEGMAESGGQWRCGPMGDQARLDSMLSKHPRIKACCHGVSSLPNVQRWLAMKDA